MIETVVRSFDSLLLLLRPLVFVLGTLSAAGALGSWAVRTRRISPFSPLARFIRERVDPWLVTPMERRLIRAGGGPVAAPWWGLAVVVVSGLLLISALQFLRDQLVVLLFATSSGTSMAMVLLRWTFSFLRIALIARVIASWVGGSPYSKWWRWSYVSTEWMLAPLRRVVPTIGMIDITVLVAYFGLGIVESLIVNGLLR